jgi:hypothetical protein
VSAVSKDNENPSQPKAGVTLPGTVNYITSIKNRFFSGNVDWDPSDRLSISSGYTYHQLTSYTPIAVPITGAPGGYAFGFSQYFMRDHYVFFDVSAKPFERLSFFASYRISLDKGQDDIPSPPISLATPNLITSYPMQMQSPEFRAVIKLTHHMDWNVGYQYYDYKDAQTPYMNYRVHLPYTSLRVYFGRDTAAR